MKIDKLKLKIHIMCRTKQRISIKNQESNGTNSYSVSSSLPQERHIMVNLSHKPHTS